MRLTGTRRSKYGARKTYYDGILFDSKAEFRRYFELKLLLKAGEIDLLTLQPVFPLIVEGVTIGKYVADFSYVLTKNGELLVEDVKGFDVPLGRWKRKHCEAQYGIQIQVIR